MIRKVECYVCGSAAGFSDDDPPVFVPGKTSKVAHASCLGEQAVQQYADWPGSPGKEVLDRLSIEDKLKLDGGWIAVLTRADQPMAFRAGSRKALEDAVNSVITAEDVNNVHVLPVRGGSCTVKVLVKLED